MIIGLTMSTVGAIFINAENLINNLIFSSGNKKNKNEKEEEKGTELKDVQDKEEKQTENK